MIVLLRNVFLILWQQRWLVNADFGEQCSSVGCARQGGAGMVEERCDSLSSLKNEAAHFPFQIKLSSSRVFFGCWVLIYPLKCAYASYFPSLRVDVPMELGIIRFAYFFVE
jgi:hypothetical protein